MASTRESSPALRSGTSSPAQLTPTSKVKAALAAFDKENGSDEDVPAGGSARERLLAAMKKSELPKSIESPRLVPTKDSRSSNRDSDSEDQDEEDIIQPKGRMAAKMHANGNSSGEDADSDNVLRKTGGRSPTKEKSTRPKSNIVSDASDENDSPVVSRKRKIRVARRQTPGSSPARPASPGLFVSPEKPIHTREADDSDSDTLPTDLASNTRFLALVEKKKQERLAREAEVAKEKAERVAELKKHAAILEEDRDADSDEEAGRRLTQQTRPSRKASKKALEEMHRETQRMSRNQQLAHNATTKKKFATAGFFAKFNFKPANQSEDISGPPRPTSSSSAAPHSDVEIKDTPPTSPADESDIEKSESILPTIGQQQTNEEQGVVEKKLPLIPSSPPTRLNKGKGKAIDVEPTLEPEVSKNHRFAQRTIRVRPPKPEDREPTVLDGSDSDLEIVAEKKLDALFDRVPAKQAKESRSIHNLRMLAHLTSPNKKNLSRKGQPGMTATELHISLQQRARQQAAREREERLQALRAKGVIIQTAEEREKEMAEVDDMLSRARQEAEELGKREKAAAKKERKDAGETDLMDDSNDDEDWQEEGDKAQDDISLSGSDEEEEEDEEALGEDTSGEEENDNAVQGESLEDTTVNPLFDNEAGETEDDEGEADLSIDEEGPRDSDVDGEEEDLPIIQNQRKPRKSNVILDEDESEDENQTPLMPQTKSPQHPQADSPAAPTSVLRSATKTFIPGLTVAGPAGLGLTQIFAGTMDESQIVPSATEPGSQSHDMKADSLAFLRRIPVPTLPPFVPTMAEDTQDIDMVDQSQGSHIPESQPMESMVNQIDLHFSQSQVHEFDSLVTSTQLSQFPEATQDGGFTHMTPIKGRFVNAPPSTAETVMLESTAVPETIEETPIVKKKGRLRRRVHVASFSDEEDNVESVAITAEENFNITGNLFDAMRKASKKKTTAEEFDKKKSGAKEMVHEQAEESEDEYAGLGGASDDESGGEEDAYVKEMIDDEGGKDVDERKLAAFFADRERANDEKQVEKLYNDITKGMLRRKRGADYELSDSDDGGEARQRRKRKEFAKARKALLADERIGKIAENPKRQAFLRAIEDRGSDDEIDFLGDFDEEESIDSQSQSQADVVPDSQPAEMGPPKRKVDNAWEAESRPPPHLRRTRPNKKPANLSEIRESLSSLIEEPNAMVAPADSDSDSGDELEIEGEDLGSGREKNKENRDPFALRRTDISIVDRISLKRASSNAISASSRLAFAATSSTLGFKVPPLLRRATTNNSITSSTSSSVSGTERMAGGEERGGVKRGGSKGSGVNYFARESERRAAVVKTEKRREQKLVKGAQVRRKVVGGMLGGGKFE